MHNHFNIKTNLIVGWLGAAVVQGIIWNKVNQLMNYSITMMFKEQPLASPGLQNTYDVFLILLLVNVS